MNIPDHFNLEHHLNTGQLLKYKTVKNKLFPRHEIYKTANKKC